MGAILTKCYIFEVYNHMTYEFLNEISGGDRDEIIDFQRVESRDLWYFQTEFMGCDLDEMIDFQITWPLILQTEFIRARYVWLQTFA